MSWGIDKNKPIEAQLEEYRDIEKELNQKRNTLDDIVSLICEALSCVNCPVVLCNADKRTEYEKKVLQNSCQKELYDWIINETKKKEECY